MKAFIDLNVSRRIASSKTGAAANGYMAKVVSWQDYHEGGPFAYSYVCGIYPEPNEALDDAMEWAGKNGYSIGSVGSVANSEEAA
jgi:hypothetical protein